MDRYDKILGGLMGVACGDALGATLEFETQNKAKEKYGVLKDIIGGGWLDLKPGEVTDDTMMTIKVAQGIINCPKNPIDKIGEGFMEWFDTSPKDIGNTINLALSYYKRHKNFEEASLYAHNMMDEKSAGNGSLMRCIPPALYYKNYDKMVEVTVTQSFLTHYDRKAADACVLYNTLVYKYLNGEEKIGVIKDMLKKQFVYQKVFEMNKEDLKPTGYVVDSLICALWCFINKDTFEDIVIEAVNLCGDSDTVGAIAGGLSGAYYGYSEIPERWKEKLILKQEITDISRKIFDGWSNQ